METTGKLARIIHRRERRDRREKVKRNVRKEFGQQFAGQPLPHLVFLRLLDTLVGLLSAFSAFSAVNPSG
jgi:hypothetical protein